MWLDLSAERKRYLLQVVPLTPPLFILDAVLEPKVWTKRRRSHIVHISSLLFTNPTMTTQGYSLTAATKQERGDNNVFVRHRLKSTPTYRRGLKIIANWIATTLSLADMIVSTPQTLSMYIILSPCQRQGCEETLPEAQRTQGIASQLE